MNCMIRQQVNRVTIQIAISHCLFIMKASQLDYELKVLQ